MKIVTCIYTGLHGSSFGGSSKIPEQFIMSLKSISKIKEHIICFTQKSDLPRLKEELKEYDNIELRIKELTDSIFHKNYIEVKKTTECYIEPLRCYELVHLKPELLNEIACEFSDDYIFWIDAGLSYKGLFPNWTFIHEDGINDWHLNNYDNKFFNENLFKNIIKKIGENLYFIGAYTDQNKIPYPNIIGGLFGGSNYLIRDFWENYRVELNKFFDQNMLYLEEKVFTHLINSRMVAPHVDIFTNWYHENSDIQIESNTKPFFKIIEQYQ